MKMLIKEDHLQVTRMALNVNRLNRARGFEFCPLAPERK